MVELHHETHYTMYIKTVTLYILVSLAGLVASQDVYVPSVRNAFEAANVRTHSSVFT